MFSSLFSKAPAASTAEEEKAKKAFDELCTAIENNAVDEFKKITQNDLARRNENGESLFDVTARCGNSDALRHLIKVAGVNAITYLSAERKSGKVVTSPLKDIFYNMVDAKNDNPQSNKYFDCLNLITIKAENYGDVFCNIIKVIVKDKSDPRHISILKILLKNKIISLAISINGLITITFVPFFLPIITAKPASLTDLPEVTDLVKNLKYQEDRVNKIAEAIKLDDADKLMELNLTNDDLTTKIDPESHVKRIGIEHLIHYAARIGSAKCLALIIKLSRENENNYAIFRTPSNIPETQSSEAALQNGHADCFIQLLQSKKCNRICIDALKAIFKKQNDSNPKIMTAIFDLIKVGALTCELKYPKIKIILMPMGKKVPTLTIKELSSEEMPNCFKNLIVFCNMKQKFNLLREAHTKFQNYLSNTSIERIYQDDIRNKWKGDSDNTEFLNFFGSDHPVARESQDRLYLFIMDNKVQFSDDLKRNFAHVFGVLTKIFARDTRLPVLLSLMEQWHFTFFKSAPTKTLTQSAQDAKTQPEPLGSPIKKSQPTNFKTL